MVAVKSLDDFDESGKLRGDRFWRVRVWPFIVHRAPIIAAAGQFLDAAFVGCLVERRTARSTATRCRGCYA